MLLVRVSPDVSKKPPMNFLPTSPPGNSIKRLSSSVSYCKRSRLTHFHTHNIDAMELADLLSSITSGVSDTSPSGTSGSAIYMFID
jgi:hypothetical protein